MRVELNTLLVWFCTWGVLTFPVTLQTARALRRRKAGQKVWGVAELFLGSAEAASLSVGAGTALQCEAECQGHMVQGFSFPVLNKFFKMRSWFRAIHLTFLEYPPHFTFFLMLLMVSCYKWDCTNSGDVLFCTFFTWGMWKIFLQLGLHLVRRISGHDFKW